MKEEKDVINNETNNKKKILIFIVLVALLITGIIVYFVLQETYSSCPGYCVGAGCCPSGCVSKNIGNSEAGQPMYTCTNPTSPGGGSGGGTNPPKPPANKCAGKYKDELSCLQMYDSCKQDSNGCWEKDNAPKPPANKPCSSSGLYDYNGCESKKKTTGGGSCTSVKNPQGDNWCYRFNPPTPKPPEKKCLPGQFTEELPCLQVNDKCKLDSNGCWVKDETSPVYPPSNCVAYEGRYPNKTKCEDVFKQPCIEKNGCWEKNENYKPPKPPEKKCLPGQFTEELPCLQVNDKCKLDSNGCWVKDETSPVYPPSNCVAYEGRYPNKTKCEDVFKQTCIEKNGCWEKEAKCLPGQFKQELDCIQIHDSCKKASNGCWEEDKSTDNKCLPGQFKQELDCIQIHDSCKKVSNGCWEKEEKCLPGQFKQELDCIQIHDSCKKASNGCWEEENPLPTVNVTFSFDGKTDSCKYKYNTAGGNTPGCIINVPTGTWNCPFGKMDSGSYLVGCSNGETSCRYECTSGDKPQPPQPPQPPKPPVITKDYVKVNIYFNNQFDSCTYDRKKGEDRCSIKVPSEKNVSVWNCPNGSHKPGENVSIHCDEGKKECDIRCTGNASSSDNVTVNVYFDDKKETCSYNKNKDPKNCQVTVPKHNNVETWYCPYGSHKPNEIVSVHCDEGNTCDVRCNSKTDISNQYDVEFKYSTEKKKTVKFDQEFEVKNPTEKNVTFKLSTNKTGAKIGPFSDSYNLKFNGWTGEKIKAEKALVDGKKWDGKLTLGTKFKSLTDISNTTVYLVANWEEKNVKLPTVVKDGKVCSFNTSEKGKGTKYESEGTYTIKNSTPNVVNLYAICESDSKTDDEITDNEKTGTILITFVWLIGLGTLGYSAYYLKKNKLDM